MSGARALVGLAASSVVAPATLGLASAVLVYRDSTDFMATLGNWMTLSLFFGIPVALFHAFAIAMPLYSMLEEHWPLRWWSAMLGGALVAMAPATIFALVFVISGALSGKALWEPLLSAGGVIASLGFAGVAAGFVFWLFARGDADRRGRERVL